MHYAHVYVSGMKNSDIKKVTMLPVDFIMHEYLHKYFGNIKKNYNKISICNMRPLSICEAPSPPAGGTGVLPPALLTHIVYWDWKIWK